jgi:hypothetical protein
MRVYVCGHSGSEWRASVTKSFSEMAILFPDALADETVVSCDPNMFPEDIQNVKYLCEIFDLKFSDKKMFYPDFVILSSPKLDNFDFTIYQKVNWFPTVFYNGKMIQIEDEDEN